MYLITASSLFFDFPITSLFDSGSNDKVFVLLTMLEVHEECSRTTFALIIKPWTLLLPSIVERLDVPNICAYSLDFPVFLIPSLFDTLAQTNYPDLLLDLRHSIASGRLSLTKFHPFELNDFLEDPMEGFEDVDLGPPETSTRDILKDFCDPEAVSLVIRRVRVPSEEAYQQAFSPFRNDTGTPYPCSQSDLEAHNTGSFQDSNNHPFVSTMEATTEVVLQNHVSRRLPPSESTAIDNLNRTVYTVEKRMEFGPDLAVKAFADLDLIFFGGRLRDNVRVQWVRATDHPRFEASGGVRGAAIQLPERGKCLILLNADLHLREDSQDEDPLRRIFGTLLHEMCHAYGIVRCGYSYSQVSNKRRGYDEFFSTRIAIVHKRALRVLGLWAVGEDALYVQYHFLEGEQTATGVVVGSVMRLVLDVDDLVVGKVDKVAEVARRGVEAVRRWVVVE